MLKTLFMPKKTAKKLPLSKDAVRVIENLKDNPERYLAYLKEHEKKLKELERKQRGYDMSEPPRKDYL